MEAVKMKKILCLGLLVVFLAGGVFAGDFDSQIKILNEEEISRLSDESLLNTYVDAAVEIEAVKSLHETAGFMPDEYTAFKELIRYRVLLIQEIKKRKLEVPAVEP